MTRPYMYHSTHQLLNGLFVLGTCRIPGMVDLCAGLLSTPTTSRLCRPFLRHTFFKHFCGGETIHDVNAVIQSYQQQHVRTILDLAIEDCHEPQRAVVVDMIINSIDIAKLSPKNFVSIKLSALATETQLNGGNIPWSELGRICEHARNCGVMVMIDAEQSSIQPAIDAVAQYLARKYNQRHCVVWNTYQMYLKDSLTRLDWDLTAGRAITGVKLVRGAYMNSEPPGLLHGSIEDTHASYNDAIRMCVQSQRLEMMVATHNRESIELATSLARPGMRVKFGQLFGMKDDLTMSLASRGFETYKYIPYGPVLTAIPYLLRRARENSALLATTSGDIDQIMNELQLRLV